MRRCLVVLFGLLPLASAAQWLFEPELGYTAILRRAEVAPAPLALPSDWTASPGLDRQLTFRFRAGRTWADKHNLHLTLAPLGLEGRLDVLRGLAAVPQPVEVGLTFSQYRLTYRYDLAKDERRLRLGLGLSANLRRLQVRAILPDGSGTTDTDAQLQPLLNLYLSYAIAGPSGPTGPRLRLLIDGDGMVTGSWRTLDLFAGLRWQLGRYGALRGGYRLLDAADEDAPYPAELQVHQAVLALIVRIGD